MSPWNAKESCECDLKKKFNEAWSMWCYVEVNDALHQIIIINAPLQENACWIWSCNATLDVYKFNMCTIIDKWKVWK